MADPRVQGHGHGFLPAASYHALTPLYDLGSWLLGAGPRFKEPVVEVAGTVDGDRVLDVGCGTGVLVTIVKRRYPTARVFGVDIDPRILVIARTRIAREAVHVTVARASADRMGFEADSFDFVISTLAFHHLPLCTKEAAIREIARVLRPGGAFFLVDLVPRRERRLDPDDANRPKRPWVTNTRDTLRRLLSDAGLQASDQPPPRAWAMSRWRFAIRGVKRDEKDIAAASPGDGAGPAVSPCTG